MNAGDYFKKSVIETFTTRNGLTLDFIISTVIALTIAILLGFLIQFLYKK